MRLVLQFGSGLNAAASACRDHQQLCSILMHMNAAGLRDLAAGSEGWVTAEIFGSDES